MNGWKSIATAPIDRDVQLWVLDRFGPRALTYPCRLTAQGWLNSELSVRLAASITPTYWREWPAPEIPPLPDAKDSPPDTNTK